MGTNQKLLSEGFEAQAKAMREFGYPDVTADMIRQNHEAWRRGEKATDVIAMFSERAFKEYPMIFGNAGETE